MTRATATPRFPLAAIALALGFALIWTATATAKPPVGKDGKIHACYRVKGKPKGALRVVKGPKARCRKGERKVAWVVAGAVGTAGAPGPQGAWGSSGSTRISCVDLSPGSESRRPDGRVWRASKGLSRTICTQTATLTSQVNSLTDALDGTVLEGVIPLGLALFIPALPSALPDYACP